MIGFALQVEELLAKEGFSKVWKICLCCILSSRCSPILRYVKDIENEENLIIKAPMLCWFLLAMLVPWNLPWGSEGLRGWQYVLVVVVCGLVFVVSAKEKAQEMIDNRKDPNNWICCSTSLTGIENHYAQKLKTYHKDPEGLLIILPWIDTLWSPTTTIE